MRLETTNTNLSFLNVPYCLPKAGQRGGFPGAGADMRLTRYPPLPQLLPEGLRLGIIVGKHALFDFENPYMVYGHPPLLWLNQNPFMAIV